MNLKPEQQFLVQWIKDAIDLLIQKDKSIISRELKEECINHRLAFWLEMIAADFGYENAAIDLEYNKNYGKYKLVEDEYGNKKSIRPDIIVHRREDNLCNYVAIECKKGYLKQDDIWKLKQFQKAPYNYKLVLGISYQPKKNYVILYFIVDGNKILKHFPKSKELREI